MGQLNLPLNALVYVDTAVLIYSVEANPNYRELRKSPLAKTKSF
jgi:hypothetical protein